ncbi:class I SAM-dependent methyltransferase [Candidatus Nitrotoga sp. M5]|uniref:class I SAM-dependent methyltransferase n=1 Tax=Candidatus Nitrotoga sp. M5 TaxID=2890409 RepID=UPI001EF3675A|nr:class I SAM-dependent methyltransferase [Candidatus Nitrotoga sp. M5]
MTTFDGDTAPLHHDGIPSPWICRHAQWIRTGGQVLDLACGSGRHTRWLAANHWQVHAVDRNETALAELQQLANVSTMATDLENDTWPYSGHHFDGIVVSRYLHRPLLPKLIESLHAGGVLIYETFMDGNERFGRPKNPDFLLRSNELLDVFFPHLTVIAYQQGEFQEPDPAVIQRICAVSKRHNNQALE